MRMNSIKLNDSQNSITGFTLSLWLQHCPHGCSGCYNIQTWSKDGGYEVSIDDVKNLILESRHKNVSFLGGESLSELNRAEVIELIRWIKEETNRTVYVWTGYLKEEVDKWIDTSIIDYLIDGKFIKEELNLKLKLRSTNNQRIFKNGKLIIDI